MKINYLTTSALVALLTISSFSAPVKAQEIVDDVVALEVVGDEPGGLGGPVWSPGHLDESVLADDEITPLPVVSASSTKERVGQKTKSNAKAKTAVFKDKKSVRKLLVTNNRGTLNQKVQDAGRTQPVYTNLKTATVRKAGATGVDQRLSGGAVLDGGPVRDHANPIGMDLEVAVE